MSKKIKITESQLKMILERRHSYLESIEEDDVKSEETKEEKEECDECGNKMQEEDGELVNEQIEKIKSQFKRFF